MRKRRRKTRRYWNHSGKRAQARSFSESFPAQIAAQGLRDSSRPRGRGESAITCSQRARFQGFVFGIRIAKAVSEKKWFQRPGFQKGVSETCSKCDFQGLISGGIVSPIALSVIAHVRFAV